MRFQQHNKCIFLKLIFNYQWLKLFQLYNLSSCNVKEYIVHTYIFIHI